ncbi:uncharacterized protein LOC116130493 [Pistacia vera]|uniref:uncharacterized protein LOC116130493 n=1 Tax=Pistacia vera TaxID=55513 RepID=UPI001263C2AD|nr:uncharacterized protein LOC116130493 [Pistacia vera]
MAQSQSQNQNHTPAAINYVVTPSVVQDAAWYMDSGATDHVTSDFAQLIVSTSYTGSEQLQVGNGNTPQLIQETIQKLNTQFPLKILGSLKYFLGFEVTRNAFGLYMNQEKYAKDILIKTKMVDCKPCSAPMAVGTKLTPDDNELFDNLALYRSTIGALQYLVLSRLDIAYSVNKLSQFLKPPTQLHWQACKRLLRYIERTSNYGGHFTKSHRFHLECFTDADWASSPNDRRSTSGCCVFLGPNLIQWHSRKQKVVALSSIEAEYRALAQGLTELA